MMARHAHRPDFDAADKASFYQRRSEQAEAENDELRMHNRRMAKALQHAIHWHDQLDEHDVAMLRDALSPTGGRMDE